MFNKNQIKLNRPYKKNFYIFYSIILLDPSNSCKKKLTNLGSSTDPNSLNTNWSVSSWASARHGSMHWRACCTLPPAWPTSGLIQILRWSPPLQNSLLWRPSTLLRGIVSTYSGPRPTSRTLSTKSIWQRTRPCSPGRAPRTLSNVSLPFQALFIFLTTKAKNCCSVGIQVCTPSKPWNIWSVRGGTGTMFTRRPTCWRITSTRGCRGLRPWWSGQPTSSATAQSTSSCATDSMFRCSFSLKVQVFKFIIFWAVSFL